MTEEPSAEETAPAEEPAAGEQIPEEKPSADETAPAEGPLPDKQAPETQPAAEEQVPEKAPQVPVFRHSNGFDEFSADEADDPYNREGKPAEAEQAKPAIRVVKGGSFD